MITAYQCHIENQSRNRKNMKHWTESHLRERLFWLGLDTKILTENWQGKYEKETSKQFGVNLLKVPWFEKMLDPSYHKPNIWFVCWEMLALLLSTKAMSEEQQYLGFYQSVSIYYIFPHLWYKLNSAE